MRTMRVALYYLPLADDPLWECGSRWLGWDSRTVCAVSRPHPQVPAGRAQAYGFHATIKAPMPLQGTLADLEAATRSLLQQHEPFRLPDLRLVLDDAFLSLRLTQSCPELHALADACVRELDSFRRPYNEEELQQRSRASYSERQRAQLRQWGYPHVFTDFVFHLTLSDAVPKPDAWLPQTQEFFSEVLLRPRFLRSLALLVQDDAKNPFRVIAEIPLGARG
ncbi:DUF1045 domain-containing protein [Acidithiobacillus sp. CV18-2]|uniref:DUF1045 domain-containing protein n=2 Tax=Igneacidithiobacillus copahuensis TaxID=2724909 RepID=A0AAE2YRV6_9PROT|nr:DUF1045 domain-containing protein [Acidithiobacillus sp. CV18-3]MBU2757746.1 DUF1045 domain-containing protein [Acidithiobacillus sp. BN09-2]MBU2777401.1 DUF1045 domain-containing protein [Acidithiobacillus sp. CV18-2]MBU2789085.1 DUF1045 domain-containing protein [Igneacidithiobacillus copahuensis]MBU2796165.1 DUF1045 domain-containing protein [Acidithiobacillus sp. VAN18-2]MBU2798506.1 DUF1045 domain-containing protein [Acidithiobacillus sp. VAN18-4]